MSGRTLSLPSFCSPSVDKTGPWLLFLYNLHKTPQSKQIDHACFSRSNDVTKALPFPLASKQKAWNKTSLSAHLRAFSSQFYVIKGDISRKLYLFIFWGGSLVILNISRHLVASWLALERWRNRRKWSHLTDRPCYYCYFGSPVMRRAAEPLLSDTTTISVDASRPGPTPPSRWTRRREPRWRLGQGGRRRKVRGPRL